MERKADQGQEEEEEAEGEEEYTYITVEEDELEGNEEDIYAVVEGEEEEYEEDDENEDVNSEQEQNSILSKASKGDSQVLSQPKSDEKASGLVGDARGQHGRPTDLRRV
jgi:hypothetical protein